MPRSRVALLSWIVGVSFFLATALTFVDRFNLVATPPALPDDVNLVDRLLGTRAYRQAIWPVFLWTNLLFAIGFAASVAFAANVASALGGLPTFKSLATTGGIIAAIASIIPLGAVNASVWQLYCDCGFRDSEIVSGFRAQIVAEDIADWLTRFASVVLAVALVMLVREARRVMSPNLRTWTWLTVIALVAAPLIVTVELLGDPSLPDWVQAVAGAILVPVWAVWLGRSVDAAAVAGTSPT